MKLHMTVLAEMMKGKEGVCVCKGAGNLDVWSSMSNKTA